MFSELFLVSESCSSNFNSLGGLSSEEANNMVMKG
jgi:hypothetical protein